MTLPILPERGGAVSGLIQGAGLGLQQALPSIQELIMNRQKQKNIQSILFPQGQSPMAGLEMGKAAEGQPQPQGLDITPEKIMAIHQIDPSMAANMARLYQGQERERMASKKAQQESAIGQDSFDRMAELLKSKKLGVGSKLKGQVFGGETAEAVGEFESLTGALESMLVDRVSRGTLSNTRFKYITETLLPKPTDRQATIKGKMKALARELNLDPSVLTGEKQEKSQMQKASKGHQLMVSPDGQIGEVETKNVKEAISKGYKLHGR
jgi:hypothetical protein